MKVLVTGGAGFIGSNLVKRVLDLGWQVSIIDNLSTGRLENLENVLHKVNFVKADIREHQVISELMPKCDLVVHLAAAVGVKNIIENPIESLETNYNGSEVILNAATKLNKRILIASTSEIYGKNPKQPLSETDDRVVGAPQKLRWTYADAKALEESLAYALYLSQGLRVTTLRFFNTVGPHQTGMYGMVVPRFVSAALQNENIEIYGDGNQTRVFCHVEDVIDALLRVIEDDSTIGEVYNIGGVGEISIKELAEKIRNICSSDSKIVYRNYEEVYPSTFEDMQRRVPNIEKLANKISWHPIRNLDAIINDVKNSML